MSIKKFFAGLMFFSFATGARAQQSWPSPEVEQMYHHANEYMAMGNLPDAITTYKQLLTFVPEKTNIMTELGNAYYLHGDYELSRETLEPILSKTDANGQMYQLVGADFVALKHIKKAESIVKEGLLHFPSSGLLYFQQGKINMEEQDEAAAVISWLDGIRKEPSFAPNYHEAALSYMGTQNVLWGLLYGETYLAMRDDTVGNATFKATLFTAWKTFFDNITDKHRTLTPFEQSIYDAYRQLTPVVSDGISTENLTMVRTRFLMAWYEKNKAAYPFSLFAYQDFLIRNGWFDIYNEWLFGQAEGAAAYKAWNTFHDGDMARFETWRKRNPLYTSFYLQTMTESAENVRSLFSKKKKR